MIIYIKKSPKGVRVFRNVFFAKFRECLKVSCIAEVKKYNFCSHTSPDRVAQRRRMETEANAKVVVSVWKRMNSSFSSKSTEAKQLAILQRTILKTGMNSSFSFNPGASHPIIQNRPRQNSYRGKELNKLLPKQTRRPLLLSRSFF